MSLKAKIEAVIYASEEPVTLAQLAGLLGEEAQAELDALAARQESLPLDEETADAADPDALNAETLGDPEPNPNASPEASAKAESEADSQTDSEAAPGPLSDPGSAAPAVPEPASGEHSDSAPSAAEATHNASPALPALTAEVLPVEAAEPPATADLASPDSASPPEPSASPAAELRARNQDARRLRDYFRSLLDELIADYARDDRGLEIREVAGGFRLATKPEYHDAVRGFVRSLKPPLKLSLQALETLAVVAYKQPVTAPEVSEIRGVDSGGVLGSLMARKLVATAGRKQVIGRPILYKTTKEFLVRFGLKDLNELPSIEEFERMAGEFAEAVQEEIPMDNPARHSEEDTTDGGSLLGDPTEVEQMANVHAAQADGIPGTTGMTTARDEDQPYSEEHLNDDDTAGAVDDAAEETLVDGRLSGLPPSYDREDRGEGDQVDSPAIDAEVQSNERDGGA
ncbi:MAG TPA: SMC-Scp complex subunit ScpB [Acidobacteriaceae bacterium]|jgi:segregation and condensation protein B|nr:SMC-Scp complex subunit ScpB [Acidobacteriaceae bacterium]